ncbi:glucosamine-6-phosphate deaminase [Virgibacillus profundi]|uniref:Glucosamine-6-phosphate deaminase n=1 Tax=Virgibacillus profundi TaxID=2024555 RepID=A0A2A2II81_9BACI|nr:glucosamine-6-phosphate deaminase [Virgibacillus profundi]PAV31006.1 glucosamine-6-phosphate deaminase [Virgibacillus profundi]PXY55191.1 glucosamine-6-phosphate deaminase [Virgibacillus profundi]
MEIVKVKNYEEMSEKASTLMIEKLNNLEKPVLGLATGSTPEGLYEILIDKNKRNEVTFENVTSFNLDEYAGLKNTDPNSYHHYMNEKLFKHIDIPKGNTHVPNGSASDLEKECQDYEALIRDKNHVDIQLLGIGGNGHIGFNEPGTPFTSRTQVINLDESTRQANARFFPSMEEVPTQAITMGIETIMESKEIILLASGENKAEAVESLINGEVTEDFPASILQKHAHVTIIADEAALSKVTSN